MFNPLVNLSGPQAHHHHGHRPHGPQKGNDVKQLLQFMVGMAAGLMASQMLGGAQHGQHGQHGHQAGFSPQQSPGFGGSLNLTGSNLNLTNPQGQSPFGLQGGPSPFGQQCGQNPFAPKAPQCSHGQAPGQGGQDPQSMLAIGIAIGMAQARQGQAGGPQAGGLNLTGSNINLVPGGNGDFGRNLSAQHPGGINITGSNVTMGAGDFAAMLGNTRGPINLTGSNINLVGGGQGAPQQGGQSPEAMLALGIQLGKAMAQQQGGGGCNHQHPQQQQTSGAFAIAGVFRTGVGGVLG